jgi:hypothetical protein
MARLTVLAAVDGDSDAYAHGATATGLSLSLSHQRPLAGHPVDG